MLQNSFKEKLETLHLPEAITLIAVSKTKPKEMIEAAYESGLRHFGENYLQDAIPKIEALAHLPDIHWHFIGHIQSNKARLAAQYFDMIQTIDSLKIAQKLSIISQDLQKSLPILVQINIGKEIQKYGFRIEEIPSILPQISSLPALELKGFMCIPPFGRDPTPFFMQMKELFNQYQAEYNLSDLSMGMSNDYTQAIAHGATMVRLGTILFGERKYKRKILPT